MLQVAALAPERWESRACRLKEAADKLGYRLTKKPSKA